MPREIILSINQTQIQPGEPPVIEIVQGGYTLIDLRVIERKLGRHVDMDEMSAFRVICNAGHSGIPIGEQLKIEQEEHRNISEQTMRVLRALIGDESF